MIRPDPDEQAGICIASCAITLSLCVCKTANVVVVKALITWSLEMRFVSVDSFQSRVNAVKEDYVMSKIMCFCCWSWVFLLLCVSMLTLVKY